MLQSSLSKSVEISSKGFCLQENEACQNLQWVSSKSESGSNGTFIFMKTTEELVYFITKHLMHMYIFTETNCTTLLTCMEYSNYHYCYDCTCTYSLRPNAQPYSLAWNIAIIITVMIAHVHIHRDQLHNLTHLHGIQQLSLLL